MTDALYLYSNLFLIGLIWTVQVVHYPSFKYVDKDKYNDFQQFHMSAITFIVMPAMVIELFSGIVLTLTQFQNLWFILSFICLVFIWGWTFFVNVPIHSKLVKDSSDDLISDLVKSNWPRTIAWSLKLVFTVLYIYNF
jgi:hypothetical protein